MRTSTIFSHSALWCCFALGLILTPTQALGQDNKYIPPDPELCEMISGVSKGKYSSSAQEAERNDVRIRGWYFLKRWCVISLRDMPSRDSAELIFVDEYTARAGLSPGPGEQDHISQHIKKYPKIDGLGDLATIITDDDRWGIYFTRGCYSVQVYPRKDYKEKPNTKEPFKQAARAIAAALDEKLKALPQCEDVESDRLPIIFLPGVAGTILTNSVGHELWPVAPVGRRQHLAFEADGKTSATGEEIKIGDMLRRPGMNFYGDFMEALEKNEYKEGTDLFAFPYDWRFSNDVHFGRLDQVINTALEKTKKKKVILTAHSMGGVIARAYIYSSPQRAEKVSKLITMGTPYWGAPKVYYGVSSGYQFGNPTVRQELMKVLLQNMPAAYQLLPQMPFIVDKTTRAKLSLDESNTIRYKWFTQHKLDLFRDSYDETVNNEAAFSPGMLKMAKDFHAVTGTKDQARPLPAGVTQHAIIGTNVATVEGFEMEDWSPGFLASAMGWKTYVEVGGRKVVLHPMVGDGDGTVPLWSLETTASTSNYYVVHSRSASAAHGDLPANLVVQAIALSIIKGKPLSPGDYPRPQTYFDKPISPPWVVEDTTQFELHSDAHLRISDASGKAIGFNADGGIDQQLPGTFLSYEGVEYAAVSDRNAPLNVSVDGIRTGKFTLNIKTRLRGKPAGEFEYREVPVVKGTKTQFTFTPGTQTTAPELVVQNGSSRTTVAPAVISPLQAAGTPAGGAGGGTPGADGTILGEIPSVGGTVSSFRFFESSGEELPPLGMRTYKNRFAKATLKGVYFEFSVKYATETAASFTINATWRRNQQSFSRQDLPISKPLNWTTSTKTYGYGNNEPGLWEAGTYTVDIEVDGRKVASGSFVVF